MAHICSIGRVWKEGRGCHAEGRCGVDCEFDVRQPNGTVEADDRRHKPEWGLIEPWTLLSQFGRQNDRVFDGMERSRARLLQGRYVELYVPDGIGGDVDIALLGMRKPGQYRPD